MKTLPILKTVFTSIVIFFINGFDLLGWDYPGEVDITEIHFNYDVNSNTYDALTIKENSTTNIIAPEWITSSKNQEFAYIKSQTNRKIKVEFYHNQNKNTIFTMIIGGGTYAGTGFGSLPYTSVYFPGNSTGYSNLTTFTFSCSVPSSVRKDSVKFVWDVVAINGDNYAYNIGITGWHNYYTVLAAPTYPMQYPWVDVLDYACRWANGVSAEVSLVTKITQGAYNEFGNSHVYEGGQTHCYGTTFLLSSFLVDTLADCRDMSAIFQLFSNALGVNSTKFRRIDGKFWYKPILPIGENTWTTISQDNWWNFHQVGWISNVYDACIKLNSPERIPVNEVLDNEYKEDLYDHGEWTPKTASKYITIL